jgi:hypothetical protein
MHPQIVADTIAGIERRGGWVRGEAGTRDLLMVNDEFRTSITIVRCMQTQIGSQRWTIRLDASLRPDITIAVRLDTANAHVLDYYLLPHVDFSRSKLRLAEENGVYLDTYRFDNLDYFFELAGRTPVGMAA